MEETINEIMVDKEDSAVIVEKATDEPEGLQCLGITAQGSRCKHKAEKNGYCMIPQHQAQGLEAAPEAVTEPEKELNFKKPTTKPWDASNNPWSLDMLRTKHKHDGFHSVWVTREKIRTHEEMGYQIANKKDYGGTTDRLPGEEGEEGTWIKRRELVLMECSLELWEQREDYIDYKTNRRQADLIAKTKGDMRKIGGGKEEIEVEHRTSRPRNLY